MAAKVVLLAACMLTFSAKAAVVGQQAIIAQEDGGDGPPEPAKAKNKQVTVIVDMLQKVKQTTQQDLVAAGKHYDTAACACTDSLAETAADMGQNAEVISKNRALMKKYSSEIGALAATNAQLKKDISQNTAALKENEDTRTAESADYVKKKFNLESNVESMASAVEIVSPAKKAEPSFLSASVESKVTEVKLMSMVSQIRPMVLQGHFPSSMLSTDIEVLKSFLDAPQKFAPGAISELQTGNPHGDFGNPSAQIDGIMKAMHDGFAADLATANSDEADSLKAYEALKLSKSQEQFTLKQELQRTTAAHADTNKDLQTSKTLLDQTAAADAADKKSFDATKTSCKNKAKAWSLTNRMRTEEIASLDRAMYQLGGSYVDTQKINAEVMHAAPAPAPAPALAAGLLQRQSGKEASNSFHKSGEKVTAMSAYLKLQALAIKSKSVDVALIAVLAKSSKGVFDKLFPRIDDMIGVLRKEEQDDITKKGYCETTLKDISNDQGDLDTDITQAGNAKSAVGAKIKDLDESIKKVSDQITKIDRVLAHEKIMRDEEKQLHQADIADKQKSVSMMQNAVDELSKGFKNGAALIQEHGHSLGAPTEKGETNIIFSMLAMLMQDVENGIKEDNADDLTAQGDYDKKMAALNARRNSNSALRIESLKDRSAKNAKDADLDELVTSKLADKDVASTKQSGVLAECAHLIVSNGFKTRRDNRKVEIVGLQEAKEVLAGGLPTL